MKWTKLEYGEWPEGEIVMRFYNYDEIKYKMGTIEVSPHDKEVYFYPYGYWNDKISIDSIYDTEPHYIALNEIERP